MIFDFIFKTRYFQNEKILIKEALMKKRLYSLFLVFAIVLCAGCAGQENIASTPVDPDPLPDSADLREEADENEELVYYSGDGVVDSADFDLFEEYFYGTWVDESGTAPNDIEFSYSGDTFSMGFYSLLDIYADSDRAYLAMTVVGETTIYAIDLHSPETMYEYYEANHGGRQRAYPDFSYTKTPVEEEESLGFFGILKLCYADKIPEEILIGNTLQTEDGAVWHNYGERLTVIEKNDQKITLKALCRAEGDDPYLLGISDKPLQSQDIYYTILLDGSGWTIGNCGYTLE